MSFDGPSYISTFRQTLRRYLFLPPLKQPAFIFVLVLFSIDALFIGLHAFLSALKYFDVLEARSFSYLKVSTEGGIPEVFNYFKLCLVAVVLMLVFRRSRIPIYLILAGMFAFALLDDAFTFHERLSMELVEALALPEMWRQSAYAQPLYFAIVAILMVPMLAAGWINADAMSRRLSGTLIAAFLALGFFVVIVDGVHSVIGKYSFVADKLFAIVEDGGEIIAVTFCCWVALSIHSYVCSGS